MTLSPTASVTGVSKVTWVGSPLPALMNVWMIPAEAPAETRDATSVLRFSTPHATMLLRVSKRVS